ncbi:MULTISPECIES: hypothetical protein [Sphaerospermopsis]|nr:MULTISPECIES: hypothetical protein [Sphaerospermopsis]
MTGLLLGMWGGRSLFGMWEGDHFLGCGEGDREARPKNHLLK